MSWLANIGLQTLVCT